MNVKFRRRNVNHISRNKEKGEDVGRGLQEKRGLEENQQVRMKHCEEMQCFFPTDYEILLA